MHTGLAYIHRMTSLRPESAIEALVRAMSVADVVITTGGVSLGDFDLVKPALLDLGAQIHFGRVDMKPGSGPSRRPT